MQVCWVAQKSRKRVSEGEAGRTVGSGELGRRKGKMDDW